MERKRSYRIKDVEDFKNLLLSYGIGIYEEDKEVVKNLLKKRKIDFLKRTAENVIKIVETYRMFRVLRYSQIVYPSLASYFGEKPKVNRIEIDKIKEPEIVGYLHFRENSYPPYYIEWIDPEFKKISNLWKR
jgi:hypothetical protein